MDDLTLEEAPPSAAVLAREREKLLLSVFGPRAGPAELATVGRSNSCHVFLEAASRIAALPPLERSVLAGLDRSSDDEGDGGSDCGGGGGGDCRGDVKRDATSRRPLSREAAPFSGGTAGAAAAAASAAGPREELPLLRVGFAESRREAAAPTTAYRYRRLAGNSGRGWPPRVDPTRREEWLCAIEFEAVFAMKFGEFRALPSWKRTILKQEVHLF